MFGNGLLLKEVKARVAIEAFQIPVLVEVFDSASHVVNFTHHIVVMGTV